MDHNTKGSAIQMLEDYEAVSASTTTLFRYLAWFMNVVGHCLLFSPIIALLKWIPLVGWLLGAVVQIAAYIFSFVWGTFLHFLILGIAWIVYRPLYGLALLAIAGIFGVMMAL